MYLIAKEGYVKPATRYTLVDERDNSVSKIYGKQIILSEKVNPDFIINVQKDKKGYKICQYPEEMRYFENV